MSKIYLPVLTLILSLAFWSCGSGGDSPFDGEEGNTVKVIENSEGGTVSTKSGYGMEILPGTLPTTDDNQDPSSTFSIETNAKVTNRLSSNFEQAISNYVEMGPRSFNFHFPLQCFFPVEGIENPLDIRVVKYDELKGKWGIIPTISHKDNPDRIGVSDINLGTYTLVNLPDWGVGGHREDDKEGGIYIDPGNEEYLYCVTIKRVSFKFPYQEEFYRNLIGYSFSAGIGNAYPLYSQLPQGEYEFWISRAKTYPANDYKDWYTYKEPISLKIDEPLQKSSSYQFCRSIGECYSNWIHLQLPADPNGYIKGRPLELPQETKVAGTGKFQATLSWTNTEEKSADLDIHLFGPDSLHVYFGNSAPYDAGFILDIDWQEEYGNAVENIYSISDNWKKGDYALKVHCFYSYYPPPMDFTVRVIHNGSVKTYNGSAKYNEEKLELYTIYEFTVE